MHAAWGHTRGVRGRGCRGSWRVHKGTPAHVLSLGCPQRPRRGAAAPSRAACSARILLVYVHLRVRSCVGAKKGWTGGFAALAPRACTIETTRVLAAGVLVDTGSVPLPHHHPRPSLPPSASPPARLLCRVSCRRMAWCSFRSSCAATSAAESGSRPTPPSGSLALAHGRASHPTS
jgi:hypothetical protein